MKFIIDILIWLLIGITFLNTLVIIVFRTGLVYTSRNEDGTLKKKIPIKGIIVTIIVLLSIIAFFLAFDFFTFFNRTSKNFLVLIFVNFALLLLLDFYDAFVIDLLILGIWKPGFLKLKKEITLSSMKKHVIKQFTIGWVLKIPIVFISSAIYYFIF